MRKFHRIANISSIFVQGQSSKSGDTLF